MKFFIRRWTQAKSLVLVPRCLMVLAVRNFCGVISLLMRCFESYRIEFGSRSVVLKCVCVITSTALYVLQIVCA